MPNLAEQICEALSGRLRVVSVEGLHKLQGYANDATRVRDLDDIPALVKIHRASLDLVQLREYFALFDQPEWFHELLVKVTA